MLKQFALECKRLEYSNNLHDIRGKTLRITHYSSRKPQAIGDPLKKLEHLWRWRLKNGPKDCMEARIAKFLPQAAINAQDGRSYSKGRSGLVSSLFCSQTSILLTHSLRGIKDVLMYRKKRYMLSFAFTRP